jgi:hypothetical protein
VCGKTGNVELTANNVGAAPTNHTHNYVTSVNNMTGSVTLDAGDVNALSLSGGDTVQDTFWIADPGHLTIKNFSSGKYSYYGLDSSGNGYINCSSGYLSSGPHFIPSSNGSKDLGTSSKKWRTVYSNSTKLDVSDETYTAKEPLKVEDALSALGSITAMIREYASSTNPATDPNLNPNDQEIISFECSQDLAAQGVQGVPILDHNNNLSATAVLSILLAVVKNLAGIHDGGN